MGQYYHASILSDSRDENGHEQVELAFYSHDFGDGLKLMEHPWIGGDFVAVVSAFLANRPYRLVWAGDYADPEPGRKVVHDGREYDLNLYGLAPDPMTRPFILGDDGEPALGIEGFDKRGARYSESDVNVEVTVDLRKSLRYFINHDKREFVDTEACAAFHPQWSSEPITVHPLPLLTCEGNGRGGGDYGDDMPGQAFIGRWARDQIGASNEAPEGGYEEIKPGFSEDPALIEEVQVAT